MLRSVLVGLFVALSCCPALSAQPPAHVWELQEIELRASRPYANPYVEVECWVELKGPGFSKRVYGFWDGGDVFRVRLVATAPGQWSWTSGSNQPADAGLNGKRGGFAARDWTEEEKRQNANRRGFLRPDANGHALQYADGTPFFLLGDTWLGAVTWRLPLTDATADPGYQAEPGVTFQAAKIVDASNAAKGVTAAGQAAAAGHQTAAGASQPAASALRATAAFTTGRYRNLFRETGHSDQEITKKIDAAFRQLFHGDPDTQAVFYWAGENGSGRLAYLSDINNHDVRSEGMSYGMMIAVQLDKKAEFDALWNWSRTFMYHESPAHPAYGFFSWSMKTDGTPNSESPAPDGEEYYTMALYFASARWGDEKGCLLYTSPSPRD